MRGVKKNTQKILASLFFSVFVLQGVFGSTLPASAQATGPVQGTTNTNAQTAGTVTAKSQGQATSDTSILSSLGDSLKDFALWVLNLIRSAIILIIASPAAVLFVWVVDPAHVSGPSGILNFPAIYTLWQFIRDFFNLFFIFILLFSAFATIFQVDSFNIRNIFKNILLSALLINFSFPITRFLIDLANVPMYYFINDVIGAGGGQGAVTAMNNLLGFSGMGAVAVTKEFIPTFAGIIFSFLFGVSLAVLSVMLIVRLIALTLLLVFSPIGFASALLPGLAKYGQKWWSNFWSYAFFGPAAALMLVVSLKFLEASRDARVWDSVQLASSNASVDGSGATLITNVIFYTIPIILLWASIGLAKEFSVAGAATVVGMGYGASRWAGKKFSGYNFGKRGLASWNKQREAARKDADARSWATKFGKNVSAAQDKITATVGVTKGQRRDARGRIDTGAADKVKESREKLQREERSVSDLHTVAGDQNADKYQRMAAAQMLAEKGVLDMTKPAGQAIVNAVRTDFGETSTVFKQMNNKIRQYDPVSAFRNMTKDTDGNAITDTQRDQRMRDYINTNEFDGKKVGASSYGDERFVRAVIEEGAVTMKDLEEVAKKSDAHRGNLRSSLATIATAADAGNGVAWDHTNATYGKQHKAIQEAHFNLTGNLSNAVSTNDAWKREVFGKMNKDFGSGANTNSIISAGHMRTVAESINPSNYKAWISSLKDKDAARVINRNVLTMGTNGNENFEALKRVANDDPFLKNFK